jgi:opacity protein-like surface antigen
MSLVRSLLLIWLMSLSVPVFADEMPYRFELTPMFGASLGGSFDTDGENGQGTDIDVKNSGNLGLAFNIKHDPNTEYEIFLSRQSTELETGDLFQNQSVVDLDIDYIQVGGTYIDDGDQVRPYISATVGVTRMDPDDSQLSSETNFSFTIGGGIRAFPTKRFGLRLEGRFLGTVVDSDSAWFCQSGSSNNSCAVQLNGSMFWQFQATAGAIFRF